jgi:hypothetical protein
LFGAVLAGGESVGIVSVKPVGIVSVKPVGTPGTLGLDLLDAPPLLAAQVSFAHGGPMLGTMRVLYAFRASAVADVERTHCHD